MTIKDHKNAAMIIYEKSGKTYRDSYIGHFSIAREHCNFRNSITIKTNPSIPRAICIIRLKEWK